MVDGRVAPNPSLTATAIYLLRTTSKDWPSIHANNNELVPYCGSTFLVSKDGSINSMGCLNDEEIRVRNRKTEIDLKVGEHRRVLDASQWAHAVLGFSQQVRAFYEEVKTADPHPRNTELWNAFELEWTERTLEAEAVTSP